MVKIQKCLSAIPIFVPLPYYTLPLFLLGIFFEIILAVKLLQF